MRDGVAVVFTAKSVAHILEDGGTQSWRMHVSHIGEFDYVVCTRNSRHPDVEGAEEHGAAFLIGKVRDVVHATDIDVIEETAGTSKQRYLIRMTEAALINIPNFWKWGRWPTHYDSLAALGIDPGQLDFKPIDILLKEVEEKTEVVPVRPAPPAPPLPQPGQIWRAVVDAAKLALGAQLGVNTSAIEITVRM